MPSNNKSANVPGIIKDVVDELAQKYDSLSDAKLYLELHGIADELEKKISKVIDPEIAEEVSTYLESLKAKDLHSLTTYIEQQKWGYSNTQAADLANIVINCDAHDVDSTLNIQEDCAKVFMFHKYLGKYIDGIDKLKIILICSKAFICLDEVRIYIEAEQYDNAIRYVLEAFKLLALVQMAHFFSSTDNANVLSSLGTSLAMKHNAYGPLRQEIEQAECLAERLYKQGSKLDHVQMAKTVVSMKKWKHAGETHLVEKFRTLGKRYGRLRGTKK